MNGINSIKISTLQRILHSKALTLVGIILFGIVMFFFLQSYAKSELIIDEVNKLESDFLSFKRKNEEMENLITYYNSNEYIEVQAKQKLGLRKNGESSIIIPNEQADLFLTDYQSLINVENQELPKNTNFIIENKDNTKKTNYKLWLDYFFK